MDNRFQKFERKWGRHAVPNLTRIMIILMAGSYLLALIWPQSAQLLSLDPYYILHGQVWRLFTWVLIAPQSPSIFTLIMLYFYFMIGSTLERTWGDFRYNLYVLGGMAISILAAFLTYFILLAVTGKPAVFGNAFSTYYICQSILLAFAATYPNMTVLFMFVIPLKIKWLGIIDGVIIAYNAFTYIRTFIATGSTQYLIYAIAIIASFANFLIFFLSSRNMRRFNPKEVKRRNDFRKAMEQNPYAGNTNRTYTQQGSRQNQAKPYIDAEYREVKPKHRCYICGRTDISDPDLTFRFCSKCSDGKEYCQDHLFTHEHS